MPKPYYKKIQEKTAEKINEHKGFFAFALVADSHLDNSIGDTLKNISAVSEKAHMDCTLHLGDIVCAGFPRKTAKRIIKKEISLFRDASPEGVFFITRGNHDGHNDVIKKKSDVLLDGDWDEAINYIDNFRGVFRPEGKPYYYVDYPEYNIRLICLNSFFYREADGDNVKGKTSGYDDLQLDWFKNVALDAPKGTTVIAFSHDAPFKNFGGDFRKDNPIHNGNEMVDAIKEKCSEKGLDFAAWLIGHYHGDMLCRAEDINFVVVASGTAYVPTLWDMPEGGYYPQRELGSQTEDLWDAVCVNTDEKKMYFFRFGAGKDRAVSY